MSALFDRAIQCRRYLRILSRVKDQQWARLLMDKRAWPEGLRLDRESGMLIIDDLGLGISHANVFMLQRLDLVRTLSRDAGVTFQGTDSGEIEARFNGITLILKTAEELSILEVLLFEHCYDFISSNSVVILDVGMNVGIPALFFAAKDSVKAVYGFEPFPETYAAAERNFNLNAAKEKITAYNFGLSNSDQSIEADYSPEFKASARTSGLPAYLAEMDGAQNLDIQKIRISLKDAGEVMRPILAKHPNSSIVVKMDCEGGEHQIIPSLEAAGLLEAIDVIMLEWHEPGPVIIENILNRAGFVILTPGRHQVIGGEHMGFLYAVRNAGLLSGEAAS